MVLNLEVKLVFDFMFTREVKLCIVLDFWLWLPLLKALTDSYRAVFGVTILQQTSGYDFIIYMLKDSD